MKKKKTKGAGDRGQKEQKEKGHTSTTITKLVKTNDWKLDYCSSPAQTKKRKYKLTG